MFSLVSLLQYQSILSSLHPQFCNLSSIFQFLFIYKSLSIILIFQSFNFLIFQKLKSTSENIPTE